MPLRVSEMRSRLVEAYPSYRFGDKGVYSDKQIVGIYRDKKPRFEWVPLGIENRDGYPTMIMERRRVH